MSANADALVTATAAEDVSITTALASAAVSQATIVAYAAESGALSTTAMKNANLRERTALISAQYWARQARLESSVLQIGAGVSQFIVGAGGITSSSSFGSAIVTKGAAPSTTKDLQPIAIRWDRDVTGTNVLFECDVRNNGNAAVVTGADPNVYGIGVAFLVDGFYVSWHDPTAGMTIAPGQTVTLIANNGPSAIATWVAGTVGPHTVTAWVDDTNRITDETNNTNNQLTATITVTAAPAPGGGGGTVSPSAPVLGTILTGGPPSVNDAVPMPPGIVIGDQLTVVYGSDHGLLITPPSGWALISNEISGITGSWVYRRTATGTEGLSQVFILSRTFDERVAFAYKNAAVDTATPIAVTPAPTFGTGIAATNSITNDVPHEMNICIVVSRTADANPVTATFPAGYTEICDGGSGWFVAVGYKDMTTSTGLTTVGVTLSGTTAPRDWHEHLIVMNPVGGSTGGGGGSGGTTGIAFATLLEKPGSDGPSAASYRATFEGAGYLNRHVGVLQNTGDQANPTIAMTVTWATGMFPNCPVSPGGPGNVSLAVADTQYIQAGLSTFDANRIVNSMVTASGYPRFILVYGSELDSVQSVLGSDSAVAAVAAHYNNDIATFRAAELAITGHNFASVCFAAISRRFSYLSDAGLRNFHDLISPSIQLIGFDHYDVAVGLAGSGYGGPAISATTGTWVDPAAAYVTNNQRDWDFYNAELTRLPTKNFFMPEWGLWYSPYGTDNRVGGKDNPYFITQTRKKLDQMGSRLVGHSYFNQDPDVPHRLDSGLVPNAQARFRSEFGA